MKRFSIITKKQAFVGVEPAETNTMRFGFYTLNPSATVTDFIGMMIFFKFIIRIGS